MGQFLERWFPRQLIPKSFLKEFEADIIYKKALESFWSHHPSDHVSIEISSKGITLYSARFEDERIAMAAFLEMQTERSTPIRVKQNYWAYLSEDKRRASIWQDRAVYLMKSPVPKEKDFFIPFFERITRERPARIQRPRHFRVFLQPETNLPALRYFTPKTPADEEDKIENKKTSILSNYFYAPWKTRQGEGILAIRLFSEEAQAKESFYSLTKPGLGRVGGVLTQWNTQLSGEKEFLLGSGQKVHTSIEKEISYSIVISHENLQNNYHILYEDAILLLIGQIPEKEARETISNIFQYLD